MQTINIPLYNNQNILLWIETALLPTVPHLLTLYLATYETTGQYEMSLNAVKA